MRVGRRKSSSGDIGSTSRAKRSGPAPPSLRETFVLDAAVHAFCRAGPEGSSVEELARMSGVNKRYIYEMYPDKESVFAAVVERETTRLKDHLLSTLVDSAGKPLREVVRGQLAALWKYAVVHPERVSLIRVAAHSRSSRVTETLEGCKDSLVRAYLDLWRRCYPDLDLSTPPIPESFGALVWGLAGALVDLALEDEARDAAEVMEVFADFILGGTQAVARHRSAATAS